MKNNQTTTEALREWDNSWKKDIAAKYGVILTYLIESQVKQLPPEEVTQGMIDKRDDLIKYIEQLIAKEKKAVLDSHVCRKDKDEES